MATARHSQLTLHRCCQAAWATVTLYHVFIPGGGLRCAGYVVKTYHPAPVGASNPQEGGSLFYRNVRYFLPLAKTLNNETRTSWFTPPHYTIVLIGEILVVSRH